jgi:hypothetical protein
MVLPEDELVAGRVEVVQFGQFKIGAGHGLGEPPGGFAVFVFDGDDPALGPGDLDQGLYGPDNIRAVTVHDMLIGIQQRFALTPVGDDRVHPGVVLDMGRETGAALTDHAGVANQF